MKTFLQILFFFLLITQICFAQWVQTSFLDRPLRYHNLLSQLERNEHQLHNQLLNKCVHKSTSDSVAEAWIKHYASGLAPMGCSGSDIAIDNEGNIYVTGSIDHPEQKSNFNTIKYNPSGKLLWAVQYNGPENEDDGARAIIVDALGNIYVTGTSSGDFTTIKYSPAGVEEWVAQYNGDGARAIALDPWGNVYVTGTSDLDFATIKYDQFGNEVWSARYNGPGNSNDGANDIAVDNLGNVYVTGGSMSTDINMDWTIIKYNPSGTHLWIVRYDGPSHDTDWANTIAVDDEGNSYVAGKIKSGYDEYFTTMKINTSGVIVWVDIYSVAYGSANDLALDSYGNIYVTGVSYASNANYLTIKYNPTGSRLWVKSYNGPSDPYGNNYDCANAILVNSVGDVFVTGLSRGVESYMDYVTIKYSTTGVQQWIARYNGPGNGGDEPSSLAVDNEGNVFVTGGCSGGYPIAGDCVTIKYNSTGNENWISTYNLLGKSLDEATAMIKDDNDNIYITGKSVGFDSFTDYCTIKYDLNGNLLWTVRYNGPGNYHDEPCAIAIDLTGNIYVTGRSFGAGTNFDYTTIKYSPSGVEQWVVRYNGSGNDVDEATNIVIDNSGNIYVTGKSKGSDTDFDYTTIKYNPDGIQQWIKQYNGPTNGADETSAIEIDIYGNIYITGRSAENSIFFNGDILTIKYDPDGNEVWNASYAGPNESWDDPRDIKVDTFENVYLTGVSGDNFTTIKYSPSGILEWVVQYSDTSLEYPWGFANALSVDESGNVFVTGGSYGLNDRLEYITIKYNSSGIEQWISRYSEPEINYNIAKAITLDSEGNIFITGESGVRAFHSLRVDYSTIKYNPSGIQLWAARYAGPGNSSPTAISLDRSGNVIVTGSSNDSIGGSNYLTIKYIQDPSSVYDQYEITATKFVLEQNYPNPFNPSTVIRYSLSVNSFVSLKVYDVLGRETKTLVNKEQPSGSYEERFTINDEPLTSGVYLYRLTAGSYTATKKMILLK